MGLDWQILSSRNVYAYLNLPMSAIKNLSDYIFPQLFKLLDRKRLNVKKLFTESNVAQQSYSLEKKNQNKHLSMLYIYIYIYTCVCVCVWTSMFCTPLYFWKRWVLGHN